MYNYTKSFARATLAKRRLSPTRKSSERRDIHTAIVRTFSELDRADELYTPRNLPTSDPLPLLYDTEENYVRTGIATVNDIVTVVDVERKTLPYDQKLIRSKTARGAQIWDGSPIYVTGVRQPESGGRSIEAGICNYFSYVTAAQKLQDEIQRSKKQSQTLAQSFGSFEKAITSEFAPIVIAATTVCTFDAGESEPVIALQHRSDEVVDANRMAGVAPIFGMESNATEYHRSRYGCVTYNFIKEFVEELFDLESVVKAASRPRASLDWIFNLPDSVDLIAEIDNGDLDLSCTGAAIELTNGSLHFCLLAQFTSRRYLDHVRERATGSWESIPASVDHPAISFIPIGSHRIDEIARVGTMDPCSIMAIDLARSALGVRGSQGTTT